MIDDMKFEPRSRYEERPVIDTITLVIWTGPATLASARAFLYAASVMLLIRRLGPCFMNFGPDCEAHEVSSHKG